MLQFLIARRHRLSHENNDKLSRVDSWNRLNQNSLRHKARVIYGIQCSCVDDIGSIALITVSQIVPLYSHIWVSGAIFAIWNE